MSANSQLRHRSEANQRCATFSAWAMSIVFAAIAAISFAVDQTVILSPAVGEGEINSLHSGESFGPLRLIEALIGRAPDQSNRAQ